MRRWFILGFAAASLALSVGGADARALHIGGFDLDRGGFESFANPDTAAMKDAIKHAFPGTIFTLKSKLTTDLTTKADVIVLGVGTSGSSAITPLTRRERTALVQFATNGGTLLLFADNETFDRDAVRANSSLLSPFGARVKGILNATQDVTLATGENPIANGPFGTIPASRHSSPAGLRDWLPSRVSELSISTPGPRLTICSRARSARAAARW
jgi:hypothetical protein